MEMMVLTLIPFLHMRQPPFRERRPKTGRINRRQDSLWTSGEIRLRRLEVAAM